jgi:hypothetical protein
VSAIEVNSVRITINGVELDVGDVSWTPNEQPTETLPQRTEFEFTMECTGGDWQAMVNALKPTTRYWARRQRKAIAMWRRRCARANGVSYRAFRRFCRTGMWKP